MTIDFADWLQNELDKQRMTPADLARVARKDQGIISRILRRERKPEADTVLAIASALKIPAETAFRAAGLLPPKPDEDPWVEQMDYKISKIRNPASRRMAEKLIDTLLADEEAEQAPRRKGKTRPATT